jgi:hypothetical protein
MGFRGYQSGWGCQILLQFFKGLLCLLSPLKIVMFLEELKERESPDAESWDEPAQSVHTSCQLLHIMVAFGRLHFSASQHLFSEIRSIPWWDTIYLSNFPKGTPNVHFSGFSFILNFSQVVEGLCQVRDGSLIFMAMSSMYALALRPSYECRHRCRPRW